MLAYDHIVVPQLMISSCVRCAESPSAMHSLGQIEVAPFPGPALQIESRTVMRLSVLAELRTTTIL